MNWIAKVCYMNNTNMDAGGEGVVEAVRCHILTVAGMTILKI